jgi:hypothetical protein
MGCNPNMDMCHPNKKRTFPEKCVYHMKWGGVVVCGILLLPVILVKNGVEILFESKSNKAIPTNTI